MTQRLRIVILLYESNEANHIAARLLAEYPDSIVAIVVSVDRDMGSMIRRTTRRLRRHGGWGFVVPKSIEVLGHRWLARWLPGRFGLSPGASHMARSGGITLIPVADINEETARNRLAELNPDLFVSVHFDQILKPDILSVPQIGTLNVHGSLLPRNRGLFPYFWALANGDEESGVTVHWIDPGIDTGAIVAQKRVGLRSKDRVASLARRSAAAGGSLLVGVLRQMLETGSATPGEAQPDAGNYVSWPDRDAIRRLRERGHRYGRLLAPVE